MLAVEYIIIILVELQFVSQNLNIICHDKDLAHDNTLSFTAVKFPENEVIRE